MVTTKELERRNRIRLSLWAYAYEFKSISMVSDDVFDTLSKAINVSQTTGNRKLDKFFRDEFNPDTGMWVHKHPELIKLEWLYNYLGVGNDKSKQRSLEVILQA